MQSVFLSIPVSFHNIASTRESNHTESDRDISGCWNKRAQKGAARLGHYETHLLLARIGLWINWSKIESGAWKDWCDWNGCKRPCL